MSGDSAFDMVRSLLCREFELDPEEILLEMSLAEDLDLDSVDGVALIVRLEEETGIRLEDEELRSLKTVEDGVELVRPQLGRG